MHTHGPTFFVFAGNNGSGKSTLRSLIVDKIGVETNIDPDMIARRFDVSQPEKRRLSAGKEVIHLINKNISEGNDFSIETTLAGKLASRQIHKAKRMGYEITMFYIGLNNVQQNIERVAMRVRNGGHHIPTKDILRRSTSTIDNLIKISPIIDHLLIIDNSQDAGNLLLSVSNGVIIDEPNELLTWVKEIKERLLGDNRHLE
ncbi:zeta toxin family protein [Alkalihalobacillus sp. LMS6]|uniref:zeta toxin family protein n=1 Tax=Alkalihalobacillus sp. LMS6 TaxID=2924034 RepID=UPI0020D179FC|nr:zeta toxin family protein [Alkalihalobacillus sp. LMS6]UTR06992.1 zeta toxin family protein [Alkalihalobacillus sp. LMS6]